MTNFDPEIATTVAALDDSSFADGSSPSAHFLRAIARSANRLLNKKNLILPLIFSTKEPGSEVIYGSNRNFGRWSWTSVLNKEAPVVFKTPGVDKLDVYLRFEGSQLGSANADKFTVQVVTRGAPFSANPSLSAANVTEVTGSGSFARVSITGVPCHPGPLEQIGIFVRGHPTDDVVDTGSYGAPASGEIQMIVNTGDYCVLVDKEDSAGNAWNFDGFSNATYANSGHMVLIRDSGGNQTISVHDILQVIPAHGSTGTFADLNTGGLIISPRVTGQAALALSGQGWLIKKAPEFRVASVMVYEAERY